MATPAGAQHRDVEQRFRDIEAKLREVATAALRRPKFEVSSGDLTINGGDLVVDGGDFLLLDTDGSTVFRLGPQQHGDRGVSIYREDGTQAVSVRKQLSGAGNQSVTVFDAAGNHLLREEVLGTGLERPYLPIPVQPVSATAGATPLVGPYGFHMDTASAAWVETHRAVFNRQNQYGRFRLRVAATDTTTAVELRVLDVSTGIALGPLGGPAWTGSRATGSTSWVEVVSPGLLLPGNYGSTATLAVQARVTAGTGTASVTVTESRGSGASA